MMTLCAARLQHYAVHKVFASFCKLIALVCLRAVGLACRSLALAWVIELNRVLQHKGDCAGTAFGAEQCAYVACWNRVSNLDAKSAVMMFTTANRLV
jgi:hypothetical protein